MSPAPLRLELLSTASEPGGVARNQDRCDFTNTGYAWVLDASSSMGPRRLAKTGTDGAWLAEHLNTVLCDLATSSYRPLPGDMLVMAAFQVRTDMEKLGIDPDDRPPYASIAAVALYGDQLHYAILGNVVLAIRREDGETTVHRDSRGEPYAQMAIELTYKYTGAALTTRQRRWEDRYVNTPEGYPVLSTSPKAASTAIVGAVPASAGDTFLIASDGLARSVDVFGNPRGFDQLIERLRQPDGVANELIELRRLEATDDRRRRRRIKVHDDATGIVATVKTARRPRRPQG